MKTKVGKAPHQGENQPGSMGSSTGNTNDQGTEQ